MKKDIQKLVEIWHSGQHKRKIGSIVISYIVGLGRLKNLTHEEYSNITLSILTCLEKYDPSFKCSFSTYVFSRFKGAILDTRRLGRRLDYYKKRHMAYEINAPKFNDVDEKFEDIIKDLSDREKKLLTYYYKHGYTMIELSEIINTTESRVCQIITGAIKKLRSELV